MGASRRQLNAAGAGDASPGPATPQRRPRGQGVAHHAPRSKIESAIAAWKASCGAIGAIEVRPDGTIRIEAPVAIEGEPPQDARTPEPW